MSRPLCSRHTLLGLGLFAAPPARTDIGHQKSTTLIGPLLAEALVASTRDIGQ